MLSHLRFHRRAPSNPPSPLPDSWDAVAQREHPHRGRDVSPHPDARPDARPPSSNSSQLPPILPPIARVASTGADLLFAPPGDAPPPLSSQNSGKPSARPAYDEETNAGFIGGVALEKHRRAAQGSQSTELPPTTMAGAQLPDNRLSRSKPPPPPINTGLGPRPAMVADKQTKPTWFSTPTDLQGPGGPLPRPTGTRLASEPAPGLGSEPQRGRKGLPFLKNPMSSLLMRRKMAQTVAETRPSAPSYDPSIRGTRVHDFSAPRPKKAVPSSDAVATRPETGKSAARGEPPAPSPSSEPASDGVYEPRFPTESHAHPRSKPVQEQPLPPAPPNDELAISLHTSSSAASRDSHVASLPPVASASVRTTASRQLSVSQLSKRDSAASAIPRHMKSTSSRFSFDMIGAAEQEKLLEERHRQREQEKKTPDGPDDARFDDFDEDFDYDAMMDDDGLEERIPGVNADYEGEGDLEAALDPDNDQENFAGFVFQRSNPASSLASPHTPAMLATPRDANGKAIGFAITKDTTPELPTADSPMFPGPLALSRPDASPDPGIQGLESNSADAQQSVFRPSYQINSAAPPPPPRADEDLYFDDGLADELDFEHDGTVFDESIFDNNDTDRFGRPIPGAFAQAQEAMKAAQKQQQQQQRQPCKRDSDVTSSASERSGTAHSTCHTSLSTGLQQLPGQQDNAANALSQQPPVGPGSTIGVASQDLAYQAALAEAAQKAAASGKFRRSSSPEVLTGLVDAHPTDSVEQPHPYLSDYEDDGFTNNFDDFDFDDEAIIAEANASALANDSDGFYGQEFGFYSAPIPQPPHGYHSHQPSSSSSGVLTKEILYQYANGGYFGPAGAGTINRTTSGRVVSREPNLTPITERSEYSNRNSVMSFTLPPAIGGGSASEGRNSAALTSPGLAQLALMADNDADGAGTMSLSALMKLRSKAWGGSQASLVSSREGSPRSERAVPSDSPAAALGGSGSPYGTVPAHLAGHVRVNSGLSLWSCSEAGSGSSAASPTVGLAPAGLSSSVSGGMMGVPPPRPGSAGAAVKGGGGGGGGSGNAAGNNGLVSSPLPLGPPISVPSLGHVGGSACSPVLEGEEAEADALLDRGTAGGPVLGPALPVGMKGLVEG